MIKQTSSLREMRGCQSNIGDLKPLRLLKLVHSVSYFNPVSQRSYQHPGVNDFHMHDMSILIEMYTIGTRYPCWSGYVTHYDIYTGHRLHICASPGLSPGEKKQPESFEFPAAYPSMRLLQKSMLIYLPRSLILRFLNFNGEPCPRNPI